MDHCISDRLNRAESRLSRFVRDADLLIALAKATRTVCAQFVQWVHTIYARKLKLWNLEKVQLRVLAAMTKEKAAENRDR